VPQRVAVLGPEGTFTEQAAVEFFGSAADLIYCQSFDEVFHATAAGTAQFGVVAVENSTEGVARSFDLFLHSPVHIIGEVSLLVRHNLLRARPGWMASRSSWRTRRRWRSARLAVQHLPHAERRPVSSNAEGARLAADNPAWASLASERAAAQFGLHIVAHAIQDEAYNRTRFAVICLPQTLACRRPRGATAPASWCRCPTSPARARHAGAAEEARREHDALRVAPGPSGQWEYYFTSTSPATRASRTSPRRW
jgi:chorismate mutase/prephenate dehydratase